MKSSVLMIAYHYPPCNESTGWQRAYFFSKYLPDFDWEPLVLTVNNRAYSRTDPGWDNAALKRLNVHRALAFDSSRHLSFKGKYIKWSTMPDRWITWLPFGVYRGLQLIRRYRPQVIWSTFPIATAHLIALSLKRLTGLPWIADFRDPMVQGGYPSDATNRAIWRRLETNVFKMADRLVFTAPGAIDNRKKIFREIPDSRYRVIENGYDESTFRNVETGFEETKRKKRIMLHSGLLYPVERNPVPFFHAVSMLLKSHQHLLENVQIHLRACGSEAYYRSLIDRYGLQQAVIMLPPLPHHEALAEICRADMLLLFQGDTCNYQIPAKIYEYFRSGRPIFGLTAPDGDTAKLLEKYGNAILAPMEDSERIYAVLKKTLENFDKQLNQKNINIERYSRYERSRELAGLLNEAISDKGIR